MLHLRPAITNRRYFPELYCAEKSFYRPLKTPEVTAGKNKPPPARAALGMKGTPPGSTVTKKKVFK